MLINWMDEWTNGPITMEGQARRKKQGYFKKALEV